MFPVLALALSTQVAVNAWLLSPAELQRIVTSSNGASATVTILDARGGRDYDRGHISSAVRIDWKDYRDGWGRTGKLSPKLEDIARRLAALGVDDRNRVVVYGDAREGWGEEGRIAWMLYYLGHPYVQVLDGGYRAWAAAGGTSVTARPRIVPGQFTLAPRASIRAFMPDVARAAGIDARPGRHESDSGEVVLDVRPRDEWDGARRYWEPRTGHIPGAVRFDWQEFMDSAGRLRSRDHLLPLLAARGVRPGRSVIVYCTGGVRSAQAFWMLRALGFADVRNFDGSWYEWAFDKSKPVAVGGPDVP